MSDNNNIESISGTVDESYADKKPSDLAEGGSWASSRPGGFLIVSLKEPSTIDNVSFDTDNTAAAADDVGVYASLNKRDWVAINNTGKTQVGKFVKIIALQMEENKTVVIRNLQINSSPLAELTADQKYQLNGGSGPAPAEPEIPTNPSQAGST